MIRLWRNPDMSAVYVIRTISLDKTHNDGSGH
jgi:hypothetical protein